MNTWNKNGISRREFISAGAAAGALLALKSSGFGEVAAAAAKGNDLNVGLIGCGDQGRVLLNACLKIPNIRFKAVCDIWSYNQRYGNRYLAKYGHTNTAYADYREMLEKEKSLDAVIVAAPDWMHSPISCAALEAGKHVYCEKLMSNTLEGARQMVLTQRKTGKLLQIGHQRRSNPRYRHVKEKLIDEANLFGRLNAANAQWNKGRQEDLGCPKGYEMDAATLAKYGYDSMDMLRNWRWYRKYGGGPICDLGAHQIDIFNWYFGTTPKTITASGGIDFYKKHEWYDNVMVIYEYELPQGTARAFYQVLTTTSSLGFLERFMGVEGTLAISENPRWNQVFREAYAPEWLPWGEKGYIKKNKPPEAPAAVAAATNAVPTEAKKDVVVDVRETAPLDQWEIPVQLTKLIHQPHLENFFDAIRNGTPLNCPADVAYQSAVTVLKVNEAVAQQKRIEMKPEDFKI